MDPSIVNLTHENNTLKMKYTEILYNYMALKNECDEYQKHKNAEYTHHKTIIKLLQEKNAELNRTIVSKTTLFQPSK